MIHALITGDLVADPVARTAANGSTFTTCSLRVPAGSDALFIGVTAFKEADQDSLRKLGKGSSLAAVGTLEQTTWSAKDGSPRVGWRLTAAELMTVYTARSRRERSGDAE